MRQRFLFKLFLVVGFLSLGGFNAFAKPALQEGSEISTLQFIIPTASYDPIRYEAGLLLTQAWEELGLSVEVTGMDFQALSQRLNSPPNDDFHAFISGYVSRPERLDPDVLLNRPFTCPGVDTGVNYQGYCSEEYDALIEAQRTTMDEALRQDLVYQTQQKLAEDLPAIALYHVTEVTAYNNTLFENPTPMMGQGLFNIWNLLSMTPITDQRMLAMGKAGDIDTVNLFAPVTGGANTDILRLIYDMLGRVRPDGTVEPWAAESWEVIDDTTVQVNVRQGMTFHDGEPVTAEDVKYSYDIQKAEGAAIYAPFLDPIEEVEQVDDYTLIFHLSQPYPALFQATFSQILIVPKHIWENVDGVLAEAQVDNPIGSGPFSWGGWQRGEVLTLMAYKDHFQAPEIDSFSSVVYATPDALFQGLVSGDVQMPDRRLLPTQIEELEQYDYLTRIEEQDFGVYYVGFNLRIPPFDDPAFRQAIAHTIDYDTIVNTLLDGYAVPGAGFIAPANAAWHDPDLTFPSFDLEAARQILTDAGYSWDDSGRLLFPAE